MTLAVLDYLNDCSFAIEFNDESKLDLVKELALFGLGIWYEAAHDEDEIEANEYFTKEDIMGFYESGYGEPTSELLDFYGIEHEIVDIKYDDNDNAICDDYVMY